MTLILSMAVGSMVLHVGDRLLTRDRARWDPQANKSLLVLGSDGYACVSYSGLAYVDSKPTDQWLAEVITGHPSGPPLRPGGGPPISASGNVPRIGPALADVRDAIQTDFMRQSGRVLGMQVEMTGFILRHAGRQSASARPFMRRYTHSGVDGTELQQGDAPRYWNWTRQILVGSIGQDARDAKRRALAALGAPGNKNHDDCERILVECVREVSEQNSSVGRDCMSLVLSREGQARVRFLPDPNNDVGQTTYCPWILAPRMTVPPMELTGALPHVANGFIVEFDRLPSTPPSGPSTASSQCRPRFP